VALALAACLAGGLMGAAPARAGNLPGGAVTAKAPAGAPPVLLPNANERRAVRGRPPPEPMESNEQAIVRRFEESLPNPLPDDAPAAAASSATPPPAAAAGDAKAGEAKAGDAKADLNGAWQGTGDDMAAPAPGIVGLPPAQAGGLGKRYLDFLSSDPAGKAVAAAWLERLSAWKDPCARALESAGIPGQMLLAAVAASGFDVEVRERAGGAGPWLLDRDAARAQGLKLGFWLDERRDPVRSTEAAAGILKPLFERFGNWPLALVGWRFGPALVEAARGDAGKGDPEAHLPRAARLYLARLSALVQLASRREAPAGAKSARTGDAFVTIAAPMAMTLDTVAQVTDVDVLTLRTLNPALLRDRVAPVAGATLRVPAGTAEVSASAFDAAAGPADRVRIESLRLGESAEALAAARKILPAELKRLHGVRDLGELRGPCEVLLPLAQEATPADSSGAPSAPDADAPEELPLVAVPARHFDLPDRTRLFYFVVEGDSIEEIAAAADVTSAEILTWNNLDPVARLQPKMILQLFVRPDLDRTRIALVEPKAVRAVEVGSEEFHALEVAGRGKKRVVYDCHAGDTLPKIARRFGLGAPDLARINRMSASSDLMPGQRIVVYAPSAGAGRPGARNGAVGRTVNLPSKRPGPNPSGAGKTPGSTSAKLAIKPRPTRPAPPPSKR
jgi:membrane-bound lytic murein transglycosylase D